MSRAADRLGRAFYRLHAGEASARSGWLVALVLAAVGAALLAGIALLSAPNPRPAPRAPATLAPISASTTLTPAPVPTRETTAQRMKLHGIAPLRTLDTPWVRHVAWSPDGRFLATAFGGSVELWDGAGRSHLFGATVADSRALSWSPTGGILAAGSGVGESKLLDAAGARVLSASQPAPGMRAAAWSPDGRLLAVPAAEFTQTRGVMLARESLLLWDPFGGNTVRTIAIPDDRNFPAPSQDWLPRVAWSSDGRYLATLSTDEKIRIWDPAGGSLLRTLDVTGTREYPDQRRVTRGFAWAPAGHTLAATAGRVVEIWDAGSGRLLRGFPDPPPPPPRLPTPVPTAPIAGPTTLPPALPPAVASVAPGVIITSWPTLPPVTATPTYAHYDQEYTEIAMLAWSPGGRSVATADGRSIRLWDVASGAQLARMVVGEQVRKLAWSPDGSVLATLDGEVIHDRFSGAQYDDLRGTIRLWDPAGTELAVAGPATAGDFAWSPDGQVLAVRTGHEAVLWGWSGAAAPGATRPAGVTPSPPAPSDSPTQACGAWLLVDSPSPGARNELYAVASAGAEAWAVGYYSMSPAVDASRPLTDARSLVLRWDGAGWSHAPSPNPGAGNNVLRGVAALAPDDVWAVGYYSATAALQQALIVHWDGSAWSQTPIAGLPAGGSSLYAVAGSAPDDVWAVGSREDRLALILHWDGSAWSEVPSPGPGIQFNALFAVAAASKTEAWAAGFFVAGYQPSPTSVVGPLALRWDGLRWKPIHANSQAEIRAIAPRAEKDAWFVGGREGYESGGNATIAGSDGAGWAEYPLSRLLRPGENISSPITHAELRGVVSLSPDDAWAVGNYHLSGSSSAVFERALAKHWDGVSWSWVALPDRPGLSLEGIAAGPGGELWAVGRNRVDMGSHGLIMRYLPRTCGNSPAGVASPVSTPGAAGSPTASISPQADARTPAATQRAVCEPGWHHAPAVDAGPLQGVAAIAPDDIWAVGHTVGPPAMTLALHWDGRRWSMVPSPNAPSDQPRPIPAGNFLHAVAAVASDDVWAVGSTDDWDAPRPLATHWDGRSWRIVPLPEGIGNGALFGVAARAAGDVWAVGRHTACVESSCGSRALILHWDGRSWTIVPGPAPAVGSSLSAVAAGGRDDVWAVGSYHSGDAEYADKKPLVLHWDGQTWGVVPSPFVPELDSQLHDIAVVAPDDIWAVGSDFDGEFVRPLAMHWDGLSWSIVASPRPSSHWGGGLLGVVALAADHAWAVGSDGGPSIARWDGKTWSLAPMRLPASGMRELYSSLQSVVALGPNDIWAVGGYEHTSILHYGAECPNEAGP